MRSMVVACLSFVAVLAPAQYPGSAAPPAELKKGFDEITVKDAQRVLKFLATQCEGRGTGQPGFEKAARFIASQFKSMHLVPLGDNGTYFQTAEFSRCRFDPKSISLSIDRPAVAIGGKDIIVRGGPPGIDIQGPLTIVDVPGNSANLGNVTFKGDLVILRSSPRNMYLESLAMDAGAGAVLGVSETAAEGSWRVRMGTTPPAMAKRAMGSISSLALSRIMRALSSVHKDSTKTSSGIQMDHYDAQVKLKASLVTETVRVGNVVAELPGSDPKLAAETVGVGGHLDHLGINDGVVYPGADDDGSGSTAVVEVARAMTANKLKPRRSIVFMTFFGEEMGLLGSRYLTDHPPVPLSQMVAELQMDMVGRDSDGVQNGDQQRVDVASENVNTIRLVGSKRISSELDKTIQEENAYIGFKFKYDAEDVYTRSDHYNFASKGIPIAFLFDGFHPDYHRPTDTVDKIDWAKLTNAAKLYYLTAMKVANSDAPPAKDVASQ